MKGNIYFCITYILLYIFYGKINAQNSSISFQCNLWTQKASLPGQARYYPAFFTIGNYAFVGCGYGSTYLHDFYKWNQKNNTWSPIESYPGSGSLGCLNASVEGKGYVGFGLGIVGIANDLWSYDTITNNWTEMTSFPGTPRYDATCFVLGHKVYVIGGSVSGPPYLNEVWVYDTHKNTWTQLNIFPGGKLEGIVTLSIGKYGYAGCGWDGINYFNSFWQYDSTNDTWASTASYPISFSDGPAAFVIRDKAYSCTGGNPTMLSEGYAYNSAIGTWTPFTNMDSIGIERGFSADFSINNYGYICAGKNNNGNYLNDLWQYYPCSDTLQSVINLAKMEKVEINVFPNPSNGTFTFQIKNEEHGMKNVELKIYNVYGQQVYSVPICQQQTTIHFLEPVGLYFYSVFAENAKMSGEGKIMILR